MHSRLTSKVALVLFMGFISAAMTVDTSSDDPCHLRIVGTGWYKSDYLCAGVCEDGGACAVQYELWTLSCGCGDVAVVDTCTGEFDYSPGGEGLFCYTTAGCETGTECEMNNSTFYTNRRACICK